MPSPSRALPCAPFLPWALCAPALAQSSSIDPAGSPEIVVTGYRFLDADTSVGAKYLIYRDLLLTVSLLEIHESNVAVCDQMVDGEALYRAGAVSLRRAF